MAGGTRGSLTPRSPHCSPTAPQSEAAKDAASHGNDGGLQLSQRANLVLLVSVGLEVPRMA